MSSAPGLSIIIPTWNNLHMLRLCLRSICQHTELSHQVIVHVNEGSDGTLDWIGRQKIEHTRTRRNVGICEALNIAFRRCRSEYIVYLNDDMYVLPGWDRRLHQCASATGDREPCYVAGTMIQASPISPVAVQGDYGANPRHFEERRLLRDYRSGKLQCSDWNGATWPPSCIHRRWWTLVGGYSEEFSPGFYSDIDFSMKLWQAGCRRFRSIGSSLVYHFGEMTTSLVRGPRRRNVKRARLQFLKKWGILPSTFVKYNLQVDNLPLTRLPETTLGKATWEFTRLRLIRMLHGARGIRHAS